MEESRSFGYLCPHCKKPVLAQRTRFALSAAAEAHARELVAAAIEAAGGAATTSVLREALGVSRKRAISILEHLDAVRFTVLDKDAGGLRSLR